MSVVVTDDITAEDSVDLEIDEYLSIAFANGFSKGTANVSAKDMKKLRPLLRFYRKKQHPFRACVKDNRKRFGALTEKYCAIIKDLIEGQTKWRKGGKKTLSELNESEQKLFSIDYPSEFASYLSEVDPEEIQEFVEEIRESDQRERGAMFAAGDLVWKPSEGFSEQKRELERVLRTEYSSKGEGDGPYTYLYVEDIAANKALVCESDMYWVLEFSHAADGSLEIPEKEDWIPVERGWLEEADVHLAEAHLCAEMFFEDGGAATEGDDGVIWKTIMREGTWRFSPGAGQVPIKKPITVNRYGKSDPEKLIISMGELYKNYKDAAVEHVTIPLSHADKVEENTGFVRDLRMNKDENGKWVLQAAHDFTEPDVRAKVTRGTIANTSAGVLFDYISKEAGKKYKAVLGHVALTNRPWLNGMKPFGVQASEGVTVLAFSEVPYESEDSHQPKEGTKMADEATETVVVKSFEEELAERLGLSEAEVTAKLAEADRLKAETRERGVADKIKAWEADRAPALVQVAKDILMADQGDNVLNLSENGKTVSLSATDIVERLMDAAKGLNLSDDPVNEAEVTGEKPAEEAEKGEKVDLSRDVKLLANQLFLEGGFSQDEAVKEAQKRLAVGAPAEDKK